MLLLTMQHTCYLNIDIGSYPFNLLPPGGGGERLTRWVGQLPDLRTLLFTPFKHYCPGTGGEGEGRLNYEVGQLSERRRQAGWLFR